MNNVNVHVVILLDLKEVFDVVDHDIMVKKLEMFGFNKNVLALFFYRVRGYCYNV
jgi:hypothetical protein